MSVGTILDPQQTLINEVKSEYDRMQLRLRELNSLIEQSQTEVRRLQQKSVDVTTQVNRLEANFDTVPRNDIRVIYTNALDTKSRLLTMQNQMEKVQQDRAQLESFSKLLAHLKEMIEGAPRGAIKGLHDGEPEPRTLDIETIIRIIQTQESERQRLARQMHDGPAQSLTNFILQAEICRRLFDRNPDRAVEELDNLKLAASTTFQRVRDFIFELRPMMLDDLGLVPTVRRYIDALSEKSNLEIHSNFIGEERRRMPPHSEVTMFRGLQELLAYARDISGATKVELVMDVSSNPVKANVGFNGKPIEETEADAEQNRGRAFGLFPLRDRVGLIGGSIEIYSVEDEQNHVNFTIPAEEIS